MENKSPEQIETIRKSLEEKIGKAVYVIEVFLESGEQVIGFLQEPRRAAKMQSIDKFINMANPSITEAGAIIVDTSLLREDSDPRFYSEIENSDNDAIYIGACMQSFKCAKIAKGAEAAKKN